MESKPAYQLKWIRTFLQLKKHTKPNYTNPNTPQKQRAKDMEQFWKSPFAEIQNLEVLSRYMIM